MLRVARHSLRWMLLCTGILLILLAVLSATARVGLPLVASYKADIEVRLSDYMRRPVEIGELALRWHGFGPQLRAVDVAVIESTERQVSLDELLVDINLFKSLWEGVPVINELTLVGAELAVEYSGGSAIQLHGVSSTGEVTLSRSSNQGLDVVAWLLNARRVGLLDARVTIIDTRSQQDFTIEVLNVRAENINNLHQLRVDLTLPQSLGSQMEIGMDLKGSANNLAGLEGNIYLKAEQLHAKGWNALRAAELPGTANMLSGFDRLDGELDVELWGRWGDARMQTARSNVSMRNLNDMRNSKPVLDRLHTELFYRDGGNGWSVRTSNLELQKGSEKALIEHLLFAWNPADETQWRLQGWGEQLPLHITSRLPAVLVSSTSGDTQRDWLEHSHPTGNLHDWRIDFSMVDGAPDVALYGKMDRLSAKSVANLPGIDGVSGSLAIDKNRGKLSLSSSDVELDLPTAYEQPLVIEQIDADLDINLTNIAAATIDGHATLLKGDLNTTSRLTIKHNAGALPHVYVQTQFELTDARQVEPLIPTRLLTRPTNTWLKNAFVGGTAKNGELLVFGNLADFPFNERQGVFRVGFDLSDATLNYLDGWPRATSLNGRVDMLGLDLKTRIRSGRLNDLQLTAGTARIPNILKPVLELSGTGDDSLQSMIDFSNNGPLSRYLRPALADASGTGHAQMDIALQVPLNKKVAAANKLTVDGSLFLQGNSLTFSRADITLNDIAGSVAFNLQGPRIRNLKANVFDSPVLVNARSLLENGEQSTEVTLTGELDPDLLLEHYELPLTRFVEGKSRWRAQLTAPHSTEQLARHGVRFSATSDLVGTSLEMPVPMGKARGKPERFRLHSAFFEDQTSTDWRIEFGNDFQARVLVEEEAMQSLAIRLGDGPLNTQLDEGIRIEGTVPSLAMDGWASSIADLIDDLPESENPELIPPVSADIRTKSLVAGVQSLGQAQIRANSDAKYLNAVVSNDAVRGNLRYPREHWRKDISAIARISHVDKRLVDALDSAPEDENSSTLDPTLLPPIEARIASFNWDELHVRDVTLRTSPKVNGLNIDTLGFAYRTTQLIGEGYWHLRDPQGVNPKLVDEHLTGLSLTLQSDDIGVGLADLGFANTVDEGEGTVSATLTWPGPAYSPELATLDGKLDADVKRGRILQVEPGAARLVGLFALQTIPRRLSFDFKDIVADGLDFQRITGQISLNKGLADVDLVQINGPVGVIDITGQSDLIAKQYDQRITVLPRVSAALPIIGLISGGASAGVGALIAGGLLKAVGVDFDRIGLREYSLTGSWDNPKLDSIPYDSKQRR